MAQLDVYRLSIEMVQQGSRMVNVLNFRVLQTDNNVNNEMAALIGLVTADVIPLYQNLISDTGLIDLLSVRGVTDPILGRDSTLNAPGTLVDQPLPLQTSALALLRTGFIGRRFNGRFYAFPTTEVNWDGTNFSATYQTALEAMLTAMVTMGPSVAFPDHQFRLLVYSQLNASGNGVQTIDVLNDARIQRRRRAGVGS